jgi:hypothetical protein
MTAREMEGIKYLRKEHYMAMKQEVVVLQNTRTKLEQYDAIMRLMTEQRMLGGSKRVKEIVNNELVEHYELLTSATDSVKEYAKHVDTIIEHPSFDEKGEVGDLDRKPFCKSTEKEQRRRQRKTQVKTKYSEG